MRALFLVGRQVYLRGLEQADLGAMVEWINDDEVTRLLYRGDRPAQLDLLVEEWERERRDPACTAFAVCDKQDDRFLGTTGLYGIHPIMRYAEFRVFIGDKAWWNRGIGTECARLMVVYGLEKLNLNKIWLGVNADNVGGVRAYEKAGFVHEGVLRQEQYRNLRYYDVVRMSILRSEYAARRDGYLERDREVE